MVSNQEGRFQRLSQVLEQFSEWSMPWTYLRETLATNGLTVQDCTLIKEIWEEANAAAHWLQPGIQSGADFAATALRKKYSWLGEGAIRNVTRGASYPWK